jgi:bisphosphoglycerate-dependent phosphoglycerate mutase
MTERLPIAYVARRETAWAISGQHTGLTDLPLTERGERNARRLGERLKGLTFARVFTSPLRRAFRTCELAGFAALDWVRRTVPTSGVMGISRLRRTSRPFIRATPAMRIATTLTRRS